MRTVVQKWGNSLGVRLPSAYARGLGLESGSTVDIREVDGTLVLRPHRERLEDLLEGVRPDNLPAEELVDRPRGAEAW